ncbi:polysaccharide deacetylase [Desulfocucumis palustris]|uniref:Polysaccharide deacetylase n=1 Tax=Desulfocucumis palustris TaxID=1898651 RepID=A0A2L2XDG3_9FIRM|nr:polysaccharide deacetylase family protein [Desulfocucumis palustris]GBF34200.1 polysaccharide deacetylase [Desulfocucumis palustris]
MRFYVFNRRTLKRKILYMTLAAMLFGGGLVSLYNSRTQPVMGQPVYHGDSRYKEIALTFNVFWGEEYIPGLLDILKENNVKSTFFMGGTWVKKFPDLTKKIHLQGHEIGSHGYSHPHPDSLSKSANIKEIEKAEGVIYEAIGVRTDLFAPPYGERGPAVLQAAQEAGYTTILWSVDTIDWQRPDPGTIVARVVQKAESGSIVLMHPTEPTVKALPEIIKGLREEGYSFVTVSGMLEHMRTESAGFRQ